MIRFADPPVSSGPEQTSLAIGTTLEDALAQFGQQQDCLECCTAVAAPRDTANGTIAHVRQTFAPLAQIGQTIRPATGKSALLRRGGFWTDVDIDARAQRLRSVRMPTALVGAQRLLAVNDLRGTIGRRPVIAVGLWALFAHPVVRTAARLGDTRDGLTAEIALSVHPDRYVLIDVERKQNLTIVLSTPDIIAAELIVLAFRASSARFRGVGPWEDPLVQAATDLALGARNTERIDIDALISPTLSSEQREEAIATLVTAAELIGVSLAE